MPVDVIVGGVKPKEQAQLASGSPAAIAGLFFFCFSLNWSGPAQSRSAPHLRTRTASLVGSMIAGVVRNFAPVPAGLVQNRGFDHFNRDIGSDF